MSKRPGTKSRATEEDALSAADVPALDVAELETLLQSFNTEAVKNDVCAQIKAFTELIKEHEGENPLGESADSKANMKYQKITLPDSGVDITGADNSLSQACALIEAWSKSNKTSVPMSADNEQQPMMSPHGVAQDPAMSSIESVRGSLLQ